MRGACRRRRRMMHRLTEIRFGFTLAEIGLGFIAPLQLGKFNRVSESTTSGMALCMREMVSSLLI